MSEDRYAEGFQEGMQKARIGLLNAQIRNCEADLDYLIDEMDLIKRLGGGKAKHIQEGKILATELNKEMLEDALRRIIKKNSYAEPIPAFSGKS